RWDSASTGMARRQLSEMLSLPAPLSNSTGGPFSPRVMTRSTPSDCGIRIDSPRSAALSRILSTAFSRHLGIVVVEQILALPPVGLIRYVVRPPDHVDPGDADGIVPIRASALTKQLAQRRRRLQQAMVPPNQESAP